MEGLPGRQRACTCSSREPSAQCLSPPPGCQLSGMPMSLPSSTSGLGTAPDVSPARDKGYTMAGPGLASCRVTLRPLSPPWGEGQMAPRCLAFSCPLLTPQLESLVPPGKSDRGVLSLGPGNSRLLTVWPLCHTQALGSMPQLCPQRHVHSQLYSPPPGLMPCACQGVPPTSDLCPLLHDSCFLMAPSGGGESSWSHLSACLNPTFLLESVGLLPLIPGHPPLVPRATSCSSLNQGQGLGLCLRNWGLLPGVSY